MKTILLIVLATLLCAQASISQELYGEQSWELTSDLNNNGWVDNGDIISNTIVITYNDRSSQTIAVQNAFADPHFSLVEGSVSTSQGTISSGNEGVDKIMLIEGLQLQASWDEATITFDAIANFDANQVTHIYNKTQLSSPTQTVETNEISIPVKSTYLATSDKAGLFDNALSLLLILLTGMLFGFISNRLKVRRLSSQHS